MTGQRVAMQPRRHNGGLGSEKQRQRRKLFGINTVHVGGNLLLPFRVQLRLSAAISASMLESENPVVLPPI